MEELGIRMKMLVKDVMSSPAITVEKEASVGEAAQLMLSHKIGCVVITNDKGRPIGIITERDLVTRVMAKNLLPSEVKCEAVMSSPLRTIDAEKTLIEAARRMSKLNIRRLGVMYKGRLIGIIVSKDILATTPEMIDVMIEKARIETGIIEETVENMPMAGYCDQCGRWSENLKETEGNFLCEECRIEIGEEY